MLGMMMSQALAKPYAYMTKNFGTEISVIDLETNKIIKTIATGGRHPIAIAIKGNRAYVLNDISNNISVINLSTNKLIGDPIDLKTTNFPGTIEIEENKAYVTHTTSSKIFVIDLDTRQVIKAILVKKFPYPYIIKIYEPDSKEETQMQQNLLTQQQRNRFSDVTIQTQDISEQDTSNPQQEWLSQVKKAVIQNDRDYLETLFNLLDEHADLNDSLTSSDLFRMFLELKEKLPNDQTSLKFLYDKTQDYSKSKKKS